MSNTVNVKTADRRKLHFDTLDEIVADAEAVTDGGETDPTVTGNWTAAQIIYHVAFTIGMANRGIDLQIPLPMRLFGKTLKLFGMHTKTFNPGIKPPPKVAAAFAPPEGTTLDAAMQKLRDEVAYAKEHGMTHPSPLFGRLTHDEWIQVNCRHAELHFGFIRAEASREGQKE
ncbi:MAG: DUF1569 domain-containing protein [Planctomycetota bacterium]